MEFLLEPAPKRALRILVVEDDPDFREVMFEMLCQTGEHAISFAENGEDGLRCLREGAYDLLVADVALPGMSGLAMLDQAGRGGLLGDALIILCSGNRMLLREAPERGVYCIPKPVDADKLYAVLRTRLPRKSGARDPEPSSRRAPIPSISGKACVEALVRGGFERIQSSVGFTILQRTLGNDTRTVLVPEFFVLSPEIVDVVLRTVGLSPSSLMKLIAAAPADAGTTRD